MASAIPVSTTPRTYLFDTITLATWKHMFLSLHRSGDGNLRMVANMNQSLCAALAFVHSYRRDKQTIPWPDSQLKPKTDEGFNFDEKTMDLLSQSLSSKQPTLSTRLRKVWAITLFTELKSSATYDQMVDFAYNALQKHVQADSGPTNPKAIEPFVKFMPDADNIPLDAALIIPVSHLKLSE